MVVRADKLTPEQRSVIEGLLGRALGEAEDVSVSTVTEEDRREAWREIEAFYERCAARRDASGISDEEEEALILEALRSTRPNYTPID